MKGRFHWVASFVGSVAWLGAACTDVGGNVIVSVSTRSDAGKSMGSGGADAATLVPECTTGGDCSAKAPICNPILGACVECTVSGDCRDPQKALCNRTLHLCAECLGDADCVDPRERCAVALHRCAAPCRADADCGSDDPRCDLAIGYCVGCRALADCTTPERPYCVEGDCVGCPTGDCP